MSATVYPQVHELQVSDELTLYTVLVEDHEGDIYTRTFVRNPSDADLADWQGCRGHLLEDKGWQMVEFPFTY